MDQTNLKIQWLLDKIKSISADLNIMKTCLNDLGQDEIKAKKYLKHPTYICKSDPGLIPDRWRIYKSCDINLLMYALNTKECDRLIVFIKDDCEMVRVHSNPMFIEYSVYWDHIVNPSVSVGAVMSLFETESLESMLKYLKGYHVYIRQNAGEVAYKIDKRIGTNLSYTLTPSHPNDIIANMFDRWTKKNTTS